MIITNATLIDRILTNLLLNFDKGFTVILLFILFSLPNPNQAYEVFLCTSAGIYNHAFPLEEVTVKAKTFQNSSKKPYYAKYLSYCGYNIKKTWDTIGQRKSINNSFLKRMIIDGIEGFDQNKIANGFNNFLRLNWSKTGIFYCTYSKKFPKICHCPRKSTQKFETK